MVTLSLWDRAEVWCTRRAIYLFSLYLYIICDSVTKVEASSLHEVSGKDSLGGG